MTSACTQRSRLRATSSSGSRDAVGELAPAGASVCAAELADGDLERRPVRSDGFSNSSATCSAGERARRSAPRRRGARSAFISRRQRRAGRSRSRGRSRGWRGSPWPGAAGGGERCPSASRPVLAVDPHVLGAEVAGPDRGVAAAAGAEVDVDLDRRCPSGARRPAARPRRAAGRSRTAARRRRAPSRGRRRTCTPERPAAATMRPQFGSAPCTAVLTSGELAIVRATCRASSMRARVAHGDRRSAWWRPRRRGRCRSPARATRRAAPSSSAG